MGKNNGSLFLALILPRARPHAQTSSYGYNKPDAKISQGVRDSFWMQSMQSSIKGAYDCIKAFSEMDFTEDLKKIDVPTLILHGDADQIVPIDPAGRLSVKADQERDAQGIRGRAARDVHDARRSGEPGSA